MIKTKVLVLGANGFVGKNIVQVLEGQESLEVFKTSRFPSQSQISFDILKTSDWKGIVNLKPDIIIDASGYGVVKNQTDLDTLYKVNYLGKRDFVTYIYKELPDMFWIQMGTAFEYSLEEESLTEQSNCFPKTHYGISKSLFTTFLREVINERFVIIRPFGMFGEGEDISKFFPMLINSQRTKVKIDLSDGSQYRDYFYVRDLATFILDIILNKSIYNLEKEIINVGSGEPKSLRELSEIAAKSIPNYESTLWNWGTIPQRLGENSKFYNASEKAFQLGFRLTPLKEAFQHTINHYFNL